MHTVTDLRLEIYRKKILNILDKTVGLSCAHLFIDLFHSMKRLNISKFMGFLYFLFLCLKLLVSCFLLFSLFLQDFLVVFFLCLRCCLMFPSLGCLFHQNQNVKSHWHHTVRCLSATSLSVFRQMELQSTVSKFESTETYCYRPACLSPHSII